MAGNELTRLVRDVMARAPITIDPEAPVETALAVMREREVRHLPVVDDGGRLVGMVTDRDVRSAIFSPAFAEHLSSGQRARLHSLTVPLANLRVRDIMTWGAVTITPEAPVAQAAAVMAEGRFGSLPVVEGGRLVGIVTESDVLKALASTLQPVRGADPDDYLP